MLGPDFWTSESSGIFLNPRLPEQERLTLEKAIRPFEKPGVMWVQSSGTESGRRGYKMVCITKAAFLAAAASVNQFFEFTSEDIFLNSLPLFHVGGLAIEARRFLCQGQVAGLGRWNTQECMELLEEKNVTVTSMVPTQIHDLTKARHQSPGCLRVVLVGGGALSQELYDRATALGWPLYPGYGMTETSAMMASRPYPADPSQDPFLFQPLSHVEFTQRENGFSVQAASLFEGYCLINSEGEGEWVSRPEPFVLDDHLRKVDNGLFKVLGRSTDFVKVLGESVSLLDLAHKVESMLLQPVRVLATPQARQGHDLHLFVEGLRSQISLEKINAKVMPFERFKSLYFIEKFPRTALGKIKISELALKLGDPRQ